MESRIFHVQGSSANSGNGLLHRKRLLQYSLASQQLKAFSSSVPNYALSYLGKYKADFTISNSAGIILDSTSFILYMTDTIYAKPNLLLSSIVTGPSLY